MKVTIENAGLGDEPIVYEFDTAQVSVEASAFADLRWGKITIMYRLRPESRPAATATVAPATEDA